MTATLSDSDRERSARIVALFAALIHAWRTDDVAEAAQAREDLNDLGVAVTLPRRAIGKAVQS